MKSSNRLNDYKRITSLFIDLFKSKKVNSRQQNLNYFQQSLNRRNPSIELIKKNYDSLRTQSKSDKTGLKPLDLLLTLKYLSKSRNQTDLSHLELLFNDVNQFWHFNLTQQHLIFMIKGYISQRKLNKSLSLLESFNQNFDLRPLFSLILAACSNQNDFNSYQSAMALLNRYNIKPDLHIYNARIKLAFQFHDQSFANELFNEMIQVANLKPDKVTYTIMLDGYSKIGDWVKCQNLEDILRQKRPDLASWTCIMMARGRRFGLDEGLNVVNEMSEYNIQPNDIGLSQLVTLSPMPQSVDECKENLDHLSSVTGVIPDKHSYQAVIEKLLHRDVNDAYEFYMIIPNQSSLNIVYPLVNALSNDKVDSAQNNLTKLMNIFNTLDSKSRLNTILIGPILRTCAKSGDVQTAIDLLIEMKSNKIDLESQLQVSFIITLMRASSDHYQAFRLYANVVDSKASIIDEAGYSTIIAEFCKLKFNDNSIVPSMLFAEILNDMRKSGYPPNCKTYTTLLDYYAKVQDAESISRIENILNVDRSIVPDMYLNNALLNAYNRTLNSTKCVDLYNAWLLSNKVDNVSLSIILDASGSKTSTIDPLNIWKSSLKYITPNRKNWETLIEALVRKRRFAEAHKVTFESNEFEVDFNAVQILFKMTRASKDEKELGKLRSLIKNEYPLYYNTLKDTVDKPWIN